MSWSDRIIDLVYTSPSGESFVGIFEDVSKVLSKKSAPFDFPDVPGTFVQDLGKKGRRYPLRWIFSGENYDIEAERFDNALEEKGAGQLQHSFYPGIKTVIPVGDITRNDPLTTAGNEAVYDIVFWETIEIVFPISELNAENTINIEIDNFSELAPVNFNDSLSVTSSSEQVGLIDSAKQGLAKIKRVMAGIAATTEAIQRTFNDAVDIIENSIDTLIGTPTLLASQMIALTRLPSQAAASIQAKLESYNTLINSFTLGSRNQFQPSPINSVPANAFSMNDLLASSAVISMIESTISEDADFITRMGTITAIESLLNSFDNYVNWSDTNREVLSADLPTPRIPGSNDLIDTGESYQALQDALSIASGRLTEIAFTALQERSIILERDRSLLDFSAEFYGEVDPQLDFIIESNQLTGSSIIELRKGQKMVYYV